MSEGAVETRTLERVPTGIRGLDTILYGGFLRGGTYIISGPPGAGKTILGNQFCFHHVAKGGRAVYVTLLAESHARMLALLGPLRFFNPEPISNALTYVSAYRTLEQEGLNGLLQLLRKEIRERKATLLIIDGLVSAEAIAESVLTFKKFIHELHTLVTLVDCTTILLTNGSTRADPENTMVDGLVELNDQLIGLRAVRELVVRKFRGSAHLRGRHFFEITGEGVIIYPRSEALLTSPVAVPDAQDNGKTLRFEVEGLDRMLYGGLPRGSTTMALGPSGSGKTTLGLHFLVAGASREEPGLFFGFSELPPRVIAKGDNIGLEMSRAVERGIIEVIWQPPVDLIVDALAERVFDELRRRRVQRLFIDGLAGFKESAVYPERIGRFFAAFTNELRALGVTTLVTEETRQLFGPGIDVPVSGLSAVMENVIFLRQVEIGSDLRRLISIIKTRDSEHDTSLREFRMTKKGIVVASTFERAEGILSGLAHEITGKAKRPRSKKGKG